MNNQPTLTSKEEIPPAIQKLCEKVNSISDGLPSLIFVPNANHSRLYPVVIISSKETSYTPKINAYLLGERLPPPSTELRQRHDLTLEAIHAAADYLPAIVFLPEKKQLHPVNLVSTVVADHLKPCYEAIQQAQKTAIGTQPIVVSHRVAAN